MSTWLAGTGWRAGWSSTFVYDDIGNRTEATYGYDGAEAGTISYQANALNQYTALTHSSDLFVLGLAASTSAVKINGVDTITRTSTSPWGPTPVDYDLPFRQGEYFSARLHADHASGPAWVPVTVEAGAVTQSGHVYHPPASETLTYDLDGNLTADGRWTYAWDGENRLVSMTTTAAAVLAGVPDQRLTFAYDAQSRRIGKVVEHATGPGSWELDSDTRFVYDGWNLLAEVEMHNSAAGGRAKDAPAGVEGPYVRRSYLWGPDVSGTMQGAGGVGGLLAVRRHARGTQGPVGYWAVWDLNGNVIGLQENARSSARVANYDYDPFGKPLRVSEPEEDLNPFRFSTKYTDAETGLCYYGFRYYDAVRGRWLNRDPIGERGGVNTFGFVGNNGLTRIDVLGKHPAVIIIIAVPLILTSCSADKEVLPPCNLCGEFETTTTTVTGYGGFGALYDGPAYEVRFWGDKCCPGGSIRLAQAIEQSGAFNGSDSHFDSTASQDHSNKGNDYKDPFPGYAGIAASDGDAGLADAPGGNGGMLGHVTTNSEVCAICTIGGKETILGCTTLTWHTGRKKIENWSGKTPKVPGELFKKAARVWQNK